MRQTVEQHVALWRRLRRVPVVDSRRCGENVPGKPEPEVFCLWADITYRRLQKVFTDSIGFFFYWLRSVYRYIRDLDQIFQVFPRTVPERNPDPLTASIYLLGESHAVHRRFTYGWQFVPCHYIVYIIKYPLSVSVAH